MQRLLGLHGLYVYNVLAVLAGNIQVLKTISVPYYGAPVAMGTFLFGTTFLVSDIITEHYGQQKAKKGITLMFSAQVLLLIFMIPSLYYPAAGDEFSHKAHEAMETLFIPCVRILIASIIAFATSLWIDIKLFVWIKERTQDKWLYLRSNISSFVSSFLDNVIFSVLAWVILSPYSVTLETLLFTYILGTYGARALISIMCTPIIYLSYFTTSRR
jgi:hypothetical protein